MIGLMPYERAFFQKSNGRDRYPWSVVAMAVCPRRCASPNRSSRRAAPSSIEYSVCTWRWTKSDPPGLAMATSVGRNTDGPDRGGGGSRGGEHPHTGEP